MNTFKINLPGQTAPAILIAQSAINDETAMQVLGEIDKILRKKSIVDKIEPWEPLVKKCIGKLEMDLIYTASNTLTYGEPE